jgi:hypothetical protein
VPEISRFFGIIIRMFYQDHAPPHFHAEHESGKILLDFRGNILQGEMRSRTALRLVREWIDLHEVELRENWDRARGGRDLQKIAPLD